MLTLDQESFLKTALPRLQEDARILGVAVGGSWLTEEMDAYSDIDLVIVVAPAHFEAVMAERMQIARASGALLTAFTGEHVGEPRLLICLYGPPLLHVDLKFVALPDFARRVDDPVILWQRESFLTQALSETDAKFPRPNLQWIEDRFWVWLHYGATKLGRGELFEVIGFLGFLREQVLGPLALMQHGHLPRGVRRLEEHISPSLLSELVETAPVYDWNACKDAMRKAADLYRRLRQDHLTPDLQIRREAEKATSVFLEEIIAPPGCDC